MRNENNATRHASAISADSDRYYRRLFDQAGVAMIATDVDLTIRASNAAAATMFGAARSGMVGSSIASVIPAEGRDAAERSLREAIEGSGVHGFEFQHHDADGRPNTLAVTVSPIIDDGGGVRGALACIRDITRRVNLESEAGVRNKMASLGRMAGALAHHLNNILGGAVTSVDYALAMDDANLQNRALVQTSDALARATKLIDSLLAFAEGDQRHQEECDLREIILSVAEYMRPEMASKDVQLELHLGEIPETRVPLAQMTTVIENILHNTVDAMPDGGTVTVTIATEGDSVVLSVTDNGCGLDPADLPKVFDPFYSTKSHGGMDFEHHPGLGLTVAHGILQGLGHSISIESITGESTTVSVHFSPGKTVAR